MKSGDDYRRTNQTPADAPDSATRARMKGFAQNFLEEFSEAETEAALESFLDLFHPQFLEKNSHFVLSGDVCTKLGFIEKGVIRAYHATEDGGEYTKTIFQEDHFVAPLASLTTGEPSPVGLQALTDVRIAVARYSDLERQNRRFHALEHFTRMVIQWEWVRKEIREIRLVTLSAEERYDLFLEEFQGLEHRIPWYCIASFLGITPVALSRIRGRKRKTN